MKVVINKTSDGLNLSHEAIMRYAKLKGITLYVVIDENWKDIFHYYTKPESERTNDGDGYWNPYTLIPRNDPILINVIEELQEMAFGPKAELKIIEIPDDVDWYIAECDGREFVAEKHRTWS